MSVKISFVQYARGLRLAFDLNYNYLTIGCRNKVHPFKLPSKPCLQSHEFSNLLILNTFGVNTN
jgi:hypothetical protein